MIIDVISKWRSVIVAFLRRSVLELVLFNNFVGNMYSGIEFTLSKFADHTKLGVVINMPSRRTLTGLRGGPVRTS